MFSQLDSALEAFKMNDPNPLCQYLRLFPLRGDCEDCGRSLVLKPHGKSLVCDECYEDREEFLNEVIK